MVAMRLASLAQDARPQRNLLTILKKPGLQRGKEAKERSRSSRRCVVLFPLNVVNWVDSFLKNKASFLSSSKCLRVLHPQRCSGGIQRHCTAWLRLLPRTIYESLQPGRRSVVPGDGRRTRKGLLAY